MPSTNFEKFFQNRRGKLLWFRQHPLGLYVKAHAVCGIYECKCHCDSRYESITKSLWLKKFFLKLYYNLIPSATRRVLRVLLICFHKHQFCRLYMNIFSTVSNFSASPFVKWTPAPSFMIYGASGHKLCTTTSNFL